MAFLLYSSLNRGHRLKCSYETPLKQNGTHIAQMELTLDQALQKGVEAHNEGKLQEAGRFYHAILQAQPRHPEANHNLGVLAVAVGNHLDAVPLFELALDATPQIEQFWLSYIDVLIKLEHMSGAKQVVADAKRAGFASHRLDALNRQIQQAPNKKNKDVKHNSKLPEKRKKLVDKKKARKTATTDVSAGAAPPQERINNLLGHFKSGSLCDAENLAELLTKEFPKHPFGWKALGLVFQQTGRLNKALVPMQKSVELSPFDAEAVGNLAVTLQELGKLEESEAICRQALALEPDAYLQHNNLGNTLQKLGRFNEAIVSFNQAIALQPDYAQTHYNLGNTLQELGALEEAEASYRQAILLQENFGKAEAQLGKVCLAQGRFEEGLQQIRRANGSIIFETDRWTIGC